MNVILLAAVIAVVAWVVVLTLRAAHIVRGAGRGEFW